MTAEFHEREAMDSSAIMARAAARGQRAETFDPDDLVQAVRQLLLDRGLHPDLPPKSGRHSMATSAAGMLLRAFGIVPAGNPRLIDRLNAPDPDSR